MALFAERPLHWGLFGCGNICFDFCVALSTLPHEKHCVEHVSARNVERARTFADSFKVKKFSGAYQKVAEDPDVDIIYIGTINTTHKELSLLAMNHGKHVLCEKPVTMNTDELEEVLACAKKNNVFFMEALWTRCFPLYRDILSKLKTGEYGDPQALLATFGIKNLFQHERISKPSLGGSVLMDIGIYALTAADIFFQDYKVKEIKACGNVVTETGIDRSLGITITYEGNKIVHLMVNGDCGLPNECHLFCADAEVSVACPFWCSEKYIVNKNGETKENAFPLPIATKKTNFHNSTGLSFEADHVRDCLLSGKMESPIVSHETSRRMMGYLDEIRQQVGVRLT